MKQNNKLVANNNWTVSASDISLDLEILASDCFRGKIVNKGNGLTIIFDNGQKFFIKVNESVKAK